MDSIQDFMISRVRVGIMELFFNKPNEMYYVREITREIGARVGVIVIEPPLLAVDHDCGIILD